MVISVDHDQLALSQIIWKCINSAGLTIEIKKLKLCKRLAIIALFSGVKQGVKLLGLLFACL